MPYNNNDNDNGSFFENNAQPSWDLLFKRPKNQRKIVCPLPFLSNGYQKTRLQKYLIPNILKRQQGSMEFNYKYCIDTFCSYYRKVSGSHLKSCDFTYLERWIYHNFRTYVNPDIRIVIRINIKQIPALFGLYYFRVSGFLEI